MTVPDAPLWERAGLRQVAGQTLRPGGFALTDRAAEHAGLVPGWCVLDVGSGLGATVRRLRSRYGADAYGVEMSASQISRAGHSPWFVQGTGHALPFAGGVFRMVLCECVLSLFPDWRIGLNELGRVLAPGGWLAVSDLCGEAQASCPSGGCTDRPLPVETVRIFLEENGFAVSLLEDHSRMLRDLAARLLLAGESGACVSHSGLGYFLMIAQKNGVAHAG